MNELQLFLVDLIAILHWIMAIIIVVVIVVVIAIPVVTEFECLQN